MSNEEKIMSRMQREKGKRGEREVAQLLRDLGYPARRTAQNCGKSGDAADVIGVEGLHLEVKRCEQIRLDDWIRQAERDAAGTGNIPVIVFRKSGEPWRAVVPAIEFFKMYKGGENESVRN